MKEDTQKDTDKAAQDALLRMTEKKRAAGEATGQKVVGYLMASEHNDGIQVLCDGRAVNLTRAQYRQLMDYPEDSDQ